MAIKKCTICGKNYNARGSETTCSLECHNIKIEKMREIRKERARAYRERKAQGLVPAKVPAGKGEDICKRKRLCQWGAHLGSGGEYYCAYFAINQELNGRVGDFCPNFVTKKRRRRNNKALMNSWMIGGDYYFDEVTDESKELPKKTKESRSENPKD